MPDATVQVEYKKSGKLAMDSPVAAPRTTRSYRLLHRDEYALHDALHHRPPCARPRRPLLRYARSGASADYGLVSLPLDHEPSVTDVLSHSLAERALPSGKPTYVHVHGTSSNLVTYRPPGH